MLELLSERNFPVGELYLLASARSAGTRLPFKDKNLKVEDLAQFDFQKVDIALFSAGGSVSAEFAPKAAAAGCIVIDNTSYFRRDTDIPLIVPEVNLHALDGYKKRNIIANPNCTTMQLVMALKPLHDAFSIERGIVSTYQSITGTGQAAIAQLEAERAGHKGAAVYPHPIDMNVIPHCDVFEENGYTREEMKVWNETKKILRDDAVQMSLSLIHI